VEEPEPKTTPPMKARHGVKFASSIFSVQGNRKILRRRQHRFGYQLRAKSRCF
jgi:hypothetical protein